MDIKEKIVIASSELILDLGVKGFTMDEVAANLGMSKRTLYEHFKDKKELIVACIESMMNSQNLYYEEMVAKSDTIINELFMMFKYMDDNFNRRGRLSFDVKKYYPDIYEEMYINHYNASCERMKDWLERGVKQGVILPNVNIELSVYVLNETINNLALRPERVMSTNLSFINSFKYVILYFFRGVSTSKGVELIDALINREKIW